MRKLFSEQNPDNYKSQTRSLRINGQSTSIRLENYFWEVIDKIAQDENLTAPAFLSRLHTEVLMMHGEVTNFTSLLRCACLMYVRINPALFSDSIE